jgi:hypothetical protein
MPVLDSPLLQSTLRDELRAAWLKIRDAHAQEKLYGFGVFTTDSASYLMVTAFSEGGLDAAVTKYLASQRGKGSDPALQRQTLRWSAADSPLHEAGSGLLPNSDKIVQELDFEGRWQADDDAGDDDDDFDDDFDDDELPDPEVEEVFQVVVQVLKELDREGLFGTGAERERLVLSVWEGDQSNVSRYAYAKALNPPAVSRRFGAEMNAGLRAFYQLYMPGEELPEDDVFD